jgi:hypothetical protein
VWTGSAAPAASVLSQTFTHAFWILIGYTCGEHGGGAAQAVATANNKKANRAFILPSLGDLVISERAGSHQGHKGSTKDTTSSLRGTFESFV